MRHFFCKFDGGLLQLLFILFQGLFDGFSFVLFFLFNHYLTRKSLETESLFRGRPGQDGTPASI